MGLLTRFRASSTASTRPPAASASAHDFNDLPPPPLPHALSTSSLYASVSRASIANSTSSPAPNGATATPSSSKFWKRKTKEGKDKGKGKGKDQEVLGVPYESTPPAPRSASTSNSFVHVPNASARSSGYDPSPSPYRHTQPTPTPFHQFDGGMKGREGSSTPPITASPQETTPKAKGVSRPTAMLGRLDFESPQHENSQSQSQPQSQYGLGHLPQEATAMARHSSYLPQHPNSSSQGYGRPQTMILDKDIGLGSSRMSQEEVMEHLVSPEKRGVWTPKSGSGSGTGLDEPEDQGSPTPRKSSLPPQELVSARTAPGPPSRSRTRESSEDHPPPTAHANAGGHSSRRPSASRRSSFIPLGNPFARRASVISDLDAQVVDDGSFQLRGFRHVSGASEADHDLDPYPHQPSAPAKSESSNNALPPPARPSSSSNSTAPTPPITRPVSRATSLASIDDHITSTAKVSAATFRKGIRRASSTQLDMDGDDDDEDDVPLGLLRPGGLGANGRSTSAYSISSMRQAKSPVVGPVLVPATKTKSQPGTPSRIQPRGSLQLEGLNKSHTRTKTVPLISPDEIHPEFPSPSNSPVPSIKRMEPAPAQQNDYFAIQPPSNGNGNGNGNGQRAQAPQTPPAGMVESPVTSSPGFDFESLDYPVSAFSTSPEVSKVIKPHSEVQGSAAKVDTASKLGLAVTIPSPSVGHGSGSGSAIPSGVTGSSGGSGTGSAPIQKKKEDTDTLDEDLIVRSMAVYGDAEADIGIENEPPLRISTRSRTHSQSTLGTEHAGADMDPNSPYSSTVRSPLSERLGNLVIHGPRPMASKPSLPKLNTLKVENNSMSVQDKEERLKSPASDTTISPIVTTREAKTPTLPSSFARASTNGSKLVTPANGNSNSDSEGTYSSTEESEGQTGNTNSKPSGSSTGPGRSSFAKAPPISKARDAESDESSDDEPLARIRTKASRSSLAVNQTSAPAPGPSGATRPATIHSSSSPSSSSVQRQNGPVSVSPPLPPSAYGRRASVPSNPVPTAHVPGQGPGKMWDASPASSQSGLTGDSAGQPITPSDQEMGNGRSFRQGPAVPTSMWDDSVSRPGRDRRGSTYSTATAPPTAGSGQAHFDTSLAAPMPLDVGDPIARQRIKELWQAQYMAAASKAFEDEWERQSNASVATPSVAPSMAHSAYSPSIHPQHSYSPYHMPPMPMAMPTNTNMGMHMPMGYGHGYPSTPSQSYMYPPGQHPYPYQPVEQSMYAYGPGAQSVYGTEFGPPTSHAHAPYSSFRPGSMVFPQSYSTSNLSQYSSPPPLPQASQRPEMQSSRSSYFDSPRHGHARGGSGDLSPPKGLIHSIPNSPSRSGVGNGPNRRSQLGTSVYSANDRPSSQSQPGPGLPPTSWRRSTAPLAKALPSPVSEREEGVEAPRRKRQSSYLVN